MGNAQIIIAPVHDAILQGILMSEISTKGPNDVFHANTTRGSAIAAVKLRCLVGNGVDVAVIAGGTCDERALYAMDIYRESPSTLCFEYAQDACRQGRIVAGVNDSGMTGVTNLATIVQSESLGEIIKNRDWERLQNEYRESGLTLYDALRNYFPRG